MILKLLIKHLCLCVCTCVCTYVHTHTHTQTLIPNDYSQEFKIREKSKSMPLCFIFSVFSAFKICASTYWLMQYMKKYFQYKIIWILPLLGYGKNVQYPAVNINLYWKWILCYMSRHITLEGMLNKWLILDIKWPFLLPVNDDMCSMLKRIST